MAKRDSKYGALEPAVRQMKDAERQLRKPLKGARIMVKWVRKRRRG
jgi:hypothetical protein